MGGGISEIKVMVDHQPTALKTMITVSFVELHHLPCDNIPIATNSIPNRQNGLNDTLAAVPCSVY